VRPFPARVPPSPDSGASSGTHSRAWGGYSGSQDPSVYAELARLLDDDARMRAGHPVWFQYWVCGSGSRTVIEAQESSKALAPVDSAPSVWRGRGREGNDVAEALVVARAAAAPGDARAERAEADADACNGAEADNPLTSSLPRRTGSPSGFRRPKAEVDEPPVMGGPPTRGAS